MEEEGGQRLAPASRDHLGRSAGGHPKGSGRSSMKSCIPAGRSCSARILSFTRWFLGEHPEHRPRHAARKMERRRKETLAALQKEGRLEGTHDSETRPGAFAHIVLVGSAGTAGHSDFLAHVQNNPMGTPSTSGASMRPFKNLQTKVGPLVAALHAAGRTAENPGGCRGPAAGWWSGGYRR